MRVPSRSGRLRLIARRWWRKFKGEVPDERLERIRRERINNIKNDVALREAMRLWLVQNEKVHRS